MLCPTRLVNLSLLLWLSLGVVLVMLLSVSYLVSLWRCVPSPHHSPLIHGSHSVLHLPWGLHALCTRRVHHFHREVYRPVCLLCGRHTVSSPHLGLRGNPLSRLSRSCLLCLHHLALCYILCYCHVLQSLG